MNRPVNRPTHRPLNRPTHRPLNRPIAPVRILIQRAGGAYKLAHEITRRFPDKPLTPQAIYQWRQVPAARCKQIEEITGGALTRQELRPDVFGD